MWGAVDGHGLLSNACPYVEAIAKKAGISHLMPQGRVMASTITPTSAATHIPPGAASPPKAAAPEKPAAAPSTASKAQQQSALNQLLVKYTYDQSHGTDAQVLSALGKQITAAAKLLGQHVTLPQAPPGAAARPAPEADEVNVTV
jgi:hypothetical protein